MSGLRIAYVINSLEGGGAALPVPAVIAEMQRFGAQVRLFALSRRDGRAAGAMDAAGIDYRVSMATKTEHLRAAHWLWREMRAYRPTLIWTSLTQSTVIGQMMGQLLRIPVISWQHNAFLKPANHRLLMGTKGLTRLWVADSQSVAQLTHARFGIAQEQIMTWPLFRANASAMAAPWVEGGAFRIGSLGRLHPNKGYDVLVDALAIIDVEAPALARSFEVVIGGEGGQRERLEARIRGYGVRNLRLAGFQADPSAFLTSLHGYVQPSRGEGLCIAAHEAMQAGLPTIVSNVGEMALTVRPGETGWVVPSDDPRTLAAAIMGMVGDKVRANRMGMAARSTVLEMFSESQFSLAARAVLLRAETMMHHG